MNEDKFFKYFRMSLGTFTELLLLLEQHLRHHDTVMRKSIPTVKRLVLICELVDIYFNENTYAFKFNSISFSAIVLNFAQRNKHMYKCIKNL